MSVLKREAPWIVNERRMSDEGFYYDEFGYKADTLFWADDLELEPTDVTELRRRISIKKCLDQGLNVAAIEAQHGSIPPDVLEHYNTYFVPYRPSVEYLRSVVLEAVTRFNDSPDRRGLLYPLDGSKVGPAASERAISHRVAFYLEQVLMEAKIIGEGSPISVDCEYNRHLGKTKTLIAKTEEIAEIVRTAGRSVARGSDEHGVDVFSISPDIIVHHRGTDDFNLLVIELKKASNKEFPEYDRLKLDLFTGSREDGYNYKVGAAVVALDNIAPPERKLHLPVPNGFWPKAP